MASRGLDNDDEFFITPSPLPSSRQDGGVSSSSQDADAPPSPTEELPLKFHLPAHCRMFSPFVRLPPEIRHQIWAETLATPGMHFLKIDTGIENSRGLGIWWIRERALLGMADEDEDVDPIAIEVDNETRPTVKQEASLKMLYPAPKADISHYITLNKQLVKLSVTCNEAASIAKNITRQSTTMRLKQGPIISLDCTSDVFYLEYVPPDVFQDGFRFSKILKCPELDRIRKVAVRYCHKWHDKRLVTRCPNCGQVHHGPESAKYPNHLYRFMAQYLPNLEHFYFIDYLIARKPGDALPPRDHADQASQTKGDVPRLQGSFYGANRTYYEVNENDHHWKVHSTVFQTQAWLREQFVKYAKKSRLSKHKSPEDVKFGVLACEWAVKPPAEAKDSRLTPAKKGRNKRAHCEEHTSWKSRRSSPEKSPPVVPENLPSDIASGFPFVFSALEGNEFDFTFSNHV
ncbi:hypothetical protein FZEAL_5916 [Fusarium zealandicum]|uniref:2EXR domain-containing protein n=1 Tax=Fusarium zealandicum TaxID=1053134 RepID=A0A8H4UJN3_9HYPO|nr:hypothetical protein FZEAL_5916 [Fusarium zealandicum]